MPVPLLDLSIQHQALGSTLMERIQSVVTSGRFIGGEEVSLFEQEMAEFCGRRQAIGCANGSDALQLVLWARGIGPGDEVIVPTFTFFATAGAVQRLGATPVFVDLDPDTFLLDLAQVEAAIGPRTRGIIPVHLFGQLAPMAELAAMATSRNLLLLEDAAQAIGATRDLQGVGSKGTAATFSFFPSKNLGAMGDGGMIVTDDDELAVALRGLRSHGMAYKRYQHDLPGTNSRLDSLQAAILRVKLPHLHGWNRARAQHAERYANLFQERGLTEHLQVPTTARGNTHTYHQYVIRVAGGRRDQLAAHLKGEGIGHAIYYPKPLHLQPVFTPLGYEAGAFPEAERASTEVLALPVFPELTKSQQLMVVDAISSFFA